MKCDSFHPDDDKIIRVLEEAFLLEELNKRFTKAMLMCDSYRGLQFRVLTDALKVFFEFVDDLDIMLWSIGNHDNRFSIIEGGFYEFRSPEECVPYLLYRTRQFGLSYQHYNDPIYLLADNIMKWVAFGGKDLLEILNESPYLIPTEEDFYIPDNLKGYE